MLENKYDDDVFFEKYGEMSRSRLGLAGAGEWPTLQPMLPPFEGKRVLDLSEKMLEVARQKNTFEQIEYRRCAMEQAEFEPGSFDVVLSSLALHYIADYAALVRRVHGWLTPGGRFIFTAEHPVFTAEGSQDWYRGEDGGILHFPVDRYFYEGARQATFLGEQVTKYHRTLTTTLRTLLQNGFAICDAAEPQPPAEMMGEPGMADEMRRPMMLIVAAQKL